LQESLRREPDFDQFLKVIKREGRPDHLPLYEHIASSGFIAERTGTPFDTWPVNHPDYWRVYVDFWLSFGFDGIPLEIPLNITLKPRQEADGALSQGSEATVAIRTMEDFEQFPWPDESNPVNFEHFERVAELLPDGAKIIGGVCAGPFEWTTWIMGVQGLSLAICLEPELVACVFDKIGALHLSAVRQIAGMDRVGVLRQGDDLGFKTSTLLAPDHLRQYVFPIYTRMVQAAHDQGKPFILHSCGNLAEVYEDLIEECGIDAKHSFEDVIMPVTDFKRQYGSRVTPLGGLDVDRICRDDEATLRAYVREVAEVCFADGYWALGTGNSLTDYMPVDQYLIVIDEGRRIA